MIFTDTITVYNYYKDPITKQESWLRSVLHGVQWRKRTERTVTAQGVVNLATVISITIPCPAEKPYVSPRQYPRLPTDIMPMYFTLDDRQGLDVIVQGEVAQEITPTYTITKLKADYGSVTISAVSDNTPRDRLKSWKVLCK